MKFIVNIPFKYDGKLYKRGEVWKPKGFRTDKHIQKMRIVSLIKEDAKRGRPKKVAPKEKENA